MILTNISFRWSLLIIPDWIRLRHRLLYQRVIISNKLCLHPCLLLRWPWHTSNPLHCSFIVILRFSFEFVSWLKDYLAGAKSLMAVLLLMRAHLHWEHLLCMLIRWACRMKLLLLLWSYVHLRKLSGLMKSSCIVKLLMYEVSIVLMWFCILMALLDSSNHLILFYLLLLDWIGIVDWADIPGWLNNLVALTGHIQVLRRYLPTSYLLTYMLKLLLLSQQPRTILSRGLHRLLLTLKVKRMPSFIIFSCLSHLLIISKVELA